jgi:hypothetical protein
VQTDQESGEEARAIEYEARNWLMLKRCGTNVVPFPAMTADQHRHLLSTLSGYRDAEPRWFREDADWLGIARPTGPRSRGCKPDIDPTSLTATVLASRREQARARINELRCTPRRTPAKPPRLKLRKRPSSPKCLKLRRRN